jgi:hypothetical protein
VQLRTGKDHGNRLISAIVVGLGALALYLKPFLQPADAEDIGPKPARDGQDPDEATPVMDTPPRGFTKAVQTKETAPQAPESADSSLTTAATIVGPAGNPVLLKFAIATAGLNIYESAANVVLPPLRNPWQENPTLGLPSTRVAQSEMADKAGAPNSPSAINFPVDNTDQPLGWPETGDNAPAPQQATAEASAARNRAPRNSGPVHLGDVGSGATLAFALGHLLAATHDADNATLTISGLHSESGAIWRADGVALYRGPRRSGRNADQLPDQRWHRGDQPNRDRECHRKPVCRHQYRRSDHWH